METTSAAPGDDAEALRVRGVATAGPTDGTVPSSGRGEPPGEPCTADPLLRALWGQWKTHVIHALGTRGACRFGVLRRALGTVSPKVLTQRLRELEADGLVWREHEPTIPPKVTYGLTPFGMRVHGVLRQFDGLAAAWADARVEPGDR